VSIGAAAWQGQVVDTVASVIRAANEALYSAKAGGRNKTFGTIIVSRQGRNVQRVESLRPLGIEGHGDLQDLIAMPVEGG